MKPLKDQHVLILGLGTSGLAMARWCVACGAQVTVADSRAAPPQLAQLRQELSAVVFISGPFNASLIEGTGIRAVFVSPGLSPDAVAEVVVVAKSQGLFLGSELSLFVQGLAMLRSERDYQPKVLAITGTNGKTTVTALTGQLVQRSGKTVAVAGNIGPTLLDTLSQCKEQNKLPEVWVLELSSFQLHYTQGFEPTAATVLNISQDHLDWHGSMATYAAAKASVFGQTALLLLNRDDAWVMAMLPAPTKARSQRKHHSFGYSLPRHPGDYGLEEVNGMVWLVRALPAEESHKIRKSQLSELHIQRLMPADALRIRGRHNALNALAAVALASAAGCSLAPVLYGLREYRGEPHRLASVGTIAEVEYFDDSKGTNVGATVAALSGLGVERKLVLILGGEGKGQDFSPLVQPVNRYGRCVVLLGRDAGLIRAALAACTVPLLAATSMAQAVGLAQQQARPGDAVLLSPACASFDMFDNYGHRAEVFCVAVRELAQDAGADLVSTS